MNIAAPSRLRGSTAPEFENGVAFLQHVRKPVKHWPRTLQISVLNVSVIWNRCANHNCARESSGCWIVISPPHLDAALLVERCFRPLRGKERGAARPPRASNAAPTRA